MFSQGTYMNYLMKLLSLLLCFEMVMGPVQGSLLISTASAQSCGAGQSLDATMNRCFTNEEVITVNEAVQSCGKDKECYKKNAQAALDKYAVAKDNDSFFQNDGSGNQKGVVVAGNAVAVGIPLLIATNVLLNKARLSKEERSNYKCSPNSLKFMYAAAAALGAGEVIGYFVHKSKLDKIQEQWDSSVVPKDDSTIDGKKVEATEAQSQAFEYLAQNEDQVAKTTRLKKGFYLAATGLFAAGTAAAVLEQIKLTKLKAEFVTASASPATSRPLTVIRSEIDKITCSTDQTYKKEGPDTAEKTEEYGKGREDSMIEESNKDVTETEAAVKAAKECKSTTPGVCDQIISQAEGKHAIAKQNAKIAEANKAKLNCANEAACKIANEKYKAEQTELERIQKEQADRADTLSKQQNEIQKKKNIVVESPEQKIRNLESQLSSNRESEINTLNKIEEIETRAKGNPSSTQKELLQMQKENLEKIRKQKNEIQQNIDKAKLPTKSSIDGLKDSKAKRVAIHNLSTAKNAEQYFELVAEMEAIEFENYSKTSYLQEDERTELRKINFDSTIASFLSGAFIPEAQANDGITKVIGGLGAVAAIYPMVNGILKGVKFKGGKPATPEMLSSDKKKVDGFISKLIGKPATRIAINAALGGWIGIMSIHMGQQAKASEARADKLRKMKEDFVGGTGLMNCSDQDRADVNKLRCYCFTSDNKRNPTRFLEKVCQNAYGTIADQTKPPAVISGEKVCVNTSMQMDAACSCKNIKGADGKNTCLKSAAGITATGISPNTFKMIGAVTAPADDLFSGATSGANISDAAGTNAARVNKASKDLLEKSDPKAAKEVDKASDSLQKGLLAVAGGYSAGSSGNESLPTSPAAAAAALDKELTKNKDADITTFGGGDNSSYSNDSVSEPAPEFGLSSSDAATQEIEIDNLMAKKIDFGNNDIETDKDKSIFKTLSDTYQQKGIKRLFKDEKIPEKAP